MDCLSSKGIVKHDNGGDCTSAYGYGIAMNLLVEEKQRDVPKRYCDVSLVLCKGMVKQDNQLQRNGIDSSRKVSNGIANI